MENDTKPGVQRPEVSLGQRKGQKRAVLSYKAILFLLLADEWNINQRDEKRVQLHTQLLQLASPVPGTLQGRSGMGQVVKRRGK